MAHGGAESTIAIATTEPGKHPRRSLLDLGYGR
jgi:hypothetical protein